MGVCTYRIVIMTATIVTAVVFAATPSGLPQHAFAAAAPPLINLGAVGNITDNDHLYLYDTSGIGTFESAGRAYVAVVSGEGVQVLDLTDPQNIVAAGRIADDDRPDLMGMMRNIVTFESAGRAYAAVVTLVDVQVLDLTDPQNIVAAGRIAHDDTTTIFPSFGIDTFESSGGTYAIVTRYGSSEYHPSNDPAIGGWTDNKVQVVQVLNLTDPYNITRASHTVHDGDQYAISDIAAFELADRAYAAAVLSYSVQVLDLTDPQNIVPAGRIGDDGSLYLEQAQYVATFESAGRTYAAVTSNEGVQVLDLTDPQNIVPAGRIVRDDSLYLDHPRDIITAELFGRTYAAVTSFDGVQVLDLTDPHDIVPAGRIYAFLSEPIAAFESVGRAYAAVGLFKGVQVIQLASDTGHSAYGNGQDDTPVNLVVTTHSPGCTAIFLLEYDVTRKTELRPTHLYSLEDMKNGLNMTFGTHAALATKLVPLLADRGEISSVASYSAGPSPMLLEHDTNPDIDTNPFTGTIQLCDVLREPLLGAAVDALLADSGPVEASGSAPHQNLIPVRIDTDNLVETLAYLKENGALIQLSLEDRDGDGGGSISANVSVPTLLALYKMDHVTDLRELVPEYHTTDDYGSIDTEIHSVNGPEVAPEPEPLEIILQNDTARDGSAAIAPPEPAGSSGTPYFGHEGMLYALAAVGAVFGSVAAVFLVRARSGKYKASGVPAIRVVRP